MDKRFLQEVLAQGGVRSQSPHHACQGSAKGLVFTGYAGYILGAALETHTLCSSSIESR